MTIDDTASKVVKSGTLLKRFEKGLYYENSALIASCSS